MAIPEAFLQRLSVIVDSTSFEAIVSSFGDPQRTCFRVNTLLAPEEATIAALQEQGMAIRKCSWMSNAYSVDQTERQKLLESDAVQSGLIYVQNLASMLPVCELDPREGESVLDLCAAPGSKTTQIAAAMNNTGYLAAVEIVRSRYFKLKANLARQGVTNARTFLKDGASVFRNRKDFFDRVLVDAPCSSEGRFRSDEPETTRYWSERKIKEMRRKQIRLLLSAFKSARVGGTIVYSTCSFAPEENEGVVTRALKKCDSFIEPEPLTVPCPGYVEPLHEWAGKSLNAGYSRRVLPDQTLTGFYISRFRKIAPTPDD